MRPPAKSVYKKSMIPSLSLMAIIESLDEIAQNGDCYGYEMFDKDKSGYYNDYAELFNELAFGAQALLDALYDADYGETFDDFTVALLGDTYTVYGWDPGELDYFRITDPDNEYVAVRQAMDRSTKLTKADMLTQFRRIMSTLLLWMDLKAAHDALFAIVTELDYKGALLETKNDAINKLYEDITGQGEAEFDRMIENLPQRMWLE